MSENTEDVKFASSIDIILSREQRLLAADLDATIMKAMAMDEGREVACAWLISDLSILVVDQADMTVQQEQDGRDDVTFSEACRSMIDIAQSMWMEIINYLKDTRDIEIHALAMLQMVLNTCQEYPSNTNDDMAKIIMDKIRDIYSEIPKEFETVDVPNIPGISDSSDYRQLMKDFFKSLIEIGTYHRDRDQYETDQQRELHDRIIAIYHRLGELDF